MRMQDIRVVYFVGIGGIGMSALARYFLREGKTVYGYDRSESALTRVLVEEGAHIVYEDKVSLVPAGVDLVVYTPAVATTQAILAYFLEGGYPVMKRSEVLGLISRSSRVIAIAGTHGKTTTTSLLTWLLRACGVDCSAFLGGISNNFSSNFVAGSSDWVVVEADEYDRSFLTLSPTMAGIIAMDPDHLEIYGTPENMFSSGFLAFANQLTPGGKLWVRHDLRGRFPDRDCLTFGVGAGDYRAEEVRVQEGRFYFDFVFPEGRLRDCSMALPGRHNIENATLALAIASRLVPKPDQLVAALAEFKGIKRRFERILTGEVEYIDDYAHHPEEIRAVVGAARELFPGKRITGVFQPHLYSRTNDLADGFAGALDLLDEAILLPLYPARELPIPGVSALTILDRMRLEKRVLLSKEALLERLEGAEVEVLLTIGAGDIDRLVAPIQELLNKK